VCPLFFVWLCRSTQGSPLLDLVLSVHMFCFCGCAGSLGDTRTTSHPSSTCSLMGFGSLRLLLWLCGLTQGTPVLDMVLSVHMFYFCGCAGSLRDTRTTSPPSSTCSLVGFGSLRLLLWLCRSTQGSTPLDLFLIMYSFIHMYMYIFLYMYT